MWGDTQSDTFGHMSLLVSSLENSLTIKEAHCYQEETVTKLLAELSLCKSWSIDSIHLLDFDQLSVEKVKLALAASNGMIGKIETTSQFEELLAAAEKFAEDSILVQKKIESIKNTFGGKSLQEGFRGFTGLQQQVCRMILHILMPKLPQDLMVSMGSMKSSANLSPPRFI